MSSLSGYEREEVDLFDGWPFTRRVVGPNVRYDKPSALPVWSRAKPAQKPKPPRPAAGVLLRHADADGVWWLLGRRHRHLGGTWANLGGSLERGEDALAGALRELEEETGFLAVELEGGTILDQIDCGTEKVPYTLFVIDVPVAVDDADLSWEHDALYWFPTDEVSCLDLHPGFARAWAILHSKES